MNRHTFSTAQYSLSLSVSLSIVLAMGTVLCNRISVKLHELLEPETIVTKTPQEQTTFVFFLSWPEKWKRAKLSAITVVLHEFTLMVKFLSPQMTFTRPANNRQLTFHEIGQSAKIPVNEVH